MLGGLCQASTAAQRNWGKLPCSFGDHQQCVLRSVADRWRDDTVQNHLVSLAAQQQAVETTPAIRRHHNKVTVVRSCNGNDRGIRVAMNLMIPSQATFADFAREFTPASRSSARARAKDPPRGMRMWWRRSVRPVWTTRTQPAFLVQRTASPRWVSALIIWTFCAGARMVGPAGFEPATKRL